MATTVPLGPATVDLTGVRAGDHNRFTVTITSNGQPLDLTGAQVNAQARRVITDTDALTAQVDILDPTQGHIAVAWDGEEVREFLGAAVHLAGVWDLQVTTQGGDPQTLAAGRFNAELDVTR